MSAPIPFGLTTRNASIAHDLAQAHATIARLERDVSRLRTELVQHRADDVRGFGPDLFDITPARAAPGGTGSGL